MNAPPNVLTLLILLPLIGVGLLLLFGGSTNGEYARKVLDKDDKISKWIALAVTLVTFALSLTLWLNFNSNTADFQFEENHAWFIGL